MWQTVEDCPLDPAWNGSMEPSPVLPDVASHIDAARRRFLDRQLTVDFIAKRLKSFQVADMKVPGGGNRTAATAPADALPLWSGVAAWERTLVSFCAVAEGGGPEAVNGALVRHRVMDFVAFVAIYCRDLGPRALALAILERSLVADRMEGGDGGKAAQYPAQLEIFKPPKLVTSMSIADGNEGNIVSGTIGEGRQDVGPMRWDECAPDKVGDLESEAAVAEQDSTHDAISTSVASIGRVGTFLAAGGMRLLHQWLIDATTPTTLPSAAAPDSKQKERGRSPVPPADTGALLLPLLRFLCVIPFDRQIVMESKIDQCISKLRRQIKKLVEEETKDLKWKQKVRIVTGGSNIGAVKETLDRLKGNWKKAYEEFGTDSKALSVEPVNTPFASLKLALLERQTLLEKDHCTDSPEWLTKIQAEATKAASKRKRKSMSTSELEKLERKKEGAALLKENLEKMQAHKRKCLAELREISRVQTEQTQVTKRHKPISKKRVHWKDGMSATSDFRKRELLEQVFMINGRDVKGSVPSNAPENSLAGEFDP